MEITTTRQNDVTVVTVSGELDSATWEEATLYLDAELESGHTNLVIDLALVTYMSSAGLRVIVGAMRKARGSGGDLRLAGAEGNIHRLLVIAGLGSVMQIFTTATQAVASYGS